MPIEYRAAPSAAEVSGDAVTGLVTPFGVATVIGDLRNDGFREDIEHGAFKKTLRERDIVFLFDHDTGKPLARTSVTEGEGSLSLSEAEDGLHADAEPVKTTYGTDLLKLAKARVVRGMSFGFEVIRDSWRDDEGRDATPQTGTRRTIHEVRLHEVSAVTFPAYVTTSLTARDAVHAARGERVGASARAAMATCTACGSPLKARDSTDNVTDSADTETSKPAKTTSDNESHEADLVSAAKFEAAMFAAETDLPA